MPSSQNTFHGDPFLTLKCESLKPQKLPFHHNSDDETPLDLNDDDDTCSSSSSSSSNESSYQVEDDEMIDSMVEQGLDDEMGMETAGNGGGLMAIAKSSGKKSAVRYYHVYGVQSKIRCRGCCEGERMDPKIYEVRRLKYKAFVLDNSRIL